MKTFAIHLWALLLLAALAGCGGAHQGDARISGRIRGLGTDTIYVYGADMVYPHVDTIVGKDDKFQKHLRIDTLTQLWMLLPGSQMRYPLFVGRGDDVRVSADSLSAPYLNAKGNPDSELLTDFLAQQADTPEVVVRIERFIRQNPAAAASAFLLRDYAIRQPDPDLKKAGELLALIDAQLRHHPQLVSLATILEAEQKVDTGVQAPSFRTRNLRNVYITQKSLGEKWLLVHFWASWDKASRQQIASFYKPLYRSANKDSLALLGISLDTSRQEWRQAVGNDTLEWEQGCDLRGWHNEVAAQLGVTSLPANVLLSPDGKIAGRNVYSPEELARLMTTRQE